MACHVSIFITKDFLKYVIVYCNNLYYVFQIEAGFYHLSCLFRFCNCLMTSFSVINSMFILNSYSIFKRQTFKDYCSLFKIQQIIITGCDSLPAFKFWHSLGTTAEHAVWTASEIFALARLRDRSEKYTVVKWV